LRPATKSNGDGRPPARHPHRALLDSGDDRLRPSTRALIESCWRAGGTVFLSPVKSSPDGAGPGAGALLADDGGATYGTTSGGGTHGDGTVFKLTPSASGPVGPRPCCTLSREAATAAFLLPG